MMICLKIVIPVVRHGHSKMITNDEKIAIDEMTTMIAITLLIAGGRLIAYHFW